jgi:hypothetical protein
MEAPPKIAKLYKIYSDKGEKVYIGSTIKQYLCNRWNDHKSDYRHKERHCTSKELFDEYGMENCKCELLESFPFTTKREMLFRERHLMESTPHCVNHQKPIITKTEEVVRVKAKQASHYKTKKEDPEWLANQRRQTAEWRKKVGSTDCDCGTRYANQHKARHLKSAKHTAWLESQ